MPHDSRKLYPLQLDTRRLFCRPFSFGMTKGGCILFSMRAPTCSLLARRILLSRPLPAIPCVRLFRLLCRVRPGSCFTSRACWRSSAFRLKWWSCWIKSRSLKNEMRAGYTLMVQHIIVELGGMLGGGTTVCSSTCAVVTKCCVGTRAVTGCGEHYEGFPNIGHLHGFAVVLHSFFSFLFWRALGSYAASSRVLRVHTAGCFLVGPSRIVATILPLLLYFRAA